MKLFAHLNTFWDNVLDIPALKWRSLEITVDGPLDIDTGQEVFYNIQAFSIWNTNISYEVMNDYAAHYYNAAWD